MNTWTIPTTDNSAPGSTYSETASTTTFHSVVYLASGYFANTAEPDATYDSHDERYSSSGESGSTTSVDGQNSTNIITWSNRGAQDINDTHSEGTYSSTNHGGQTGSRKNSYYGATNQNSITNSWTGETGYTDPNYNTGLTTSSSSTEWVNEYTRTLYDSSTSTFTETCAITTETTIESTAYSQSGSSFIETSTTYSTLTTTDSTRSNSSYIVTSTGTGTYWQNNVATVILMDSSETGWIINTGATGSGSIPDKMISFTQTTIKPLDFLTIVTAAYSPAVISSGSPATITLITNSSSSVLRNDTWTYVTSSSVASKAIQGTQIPLSTTTEERYTDGYLVTQTSVFSTNSTTQLVYGYWIKNGTTTYPVNSTIWYVASEGGRATGTSERNITTWSKSSFQSSFAISPLTTYSSSTSNYTTSSTTYDGSSFTNHYGDTGSTVESSQESKSGDGSTTYALGNTINFWTGGGLAYLQKINNYGFQFAPLSTESTITFTNISANHTIPIPYDIWSSYGQYDFKAGVTYQNTISAISDSITYKYSFSQKSLTATTSSTYTSLSSTQTVTATNSGTFTDQIVGVGTATGDLSEVSTSSIFGGNNFRSQLQMSYTLLNGVYLVYSDGTATISTHTGGTKAIASNHVMGIDTIPGVSIALDTYSNRPTTRATSWHNPDWITGA